MDNWCDNVTCDKKKCDKNVEKVSARNILCNESSYIELYALLDVEGAACQNNTWSPWGKWQCKISVRTGESMSSSVQQWPGMYSNSFYIRNTESCLRQGYIYFLSVVLWWYQCISVWFQVTIMKNVQNIINTIQMIHSFSLYYNKREITTILLIKVCEFSLVKEIYKLYIEIADVNTQCNGTVSFVMEFLQHMIRLQIRWSQHAGCIWLTMGLLWYGTKIPKTLSRKLRWWWHLPTWIQHLLCTITEEMIGHTTICMISNKFPIFSRSASACVRSTSLASRKQRTRPWKHLERGPLIFQRWIFF